MGGRAGTDVRLVKGSGGVFEIMIDGDLAFSKKQLGRFPTDEELDALAERVASGRPEP